LGKINRCSVLGRDLDCLLAVKNQSLAVESFFDRLFDLLEYIEECTAVVFVHVYGGSDIYYIHDYRGVYEGLVLSLCHEGCTGLFAKFCSTSQKLIMTKLCFDHYVK
jgi:hypothetical protein